MDFAKMKIAGGWAMDRERFSENAKKVFEVAVNHRRQFLILDDRAIQGERFNDDGGVLARLESMFTEAEFMICPGTRIDAALTDAAQSDHWYKFEKRYDDYCMADDTEIENDDE